MRTRIILSLTSVSFPIFQPTSGSPFLGNRPVNTFRKTLADNNRTSIARQPSRKRASSIEALFLCGPCQRTVRGSRITEKLIFTKKSWIKDTKPSWKGIVQSPVENSVLYERLWREGFMCHNWSTWLSENIVEICYLAMTNINRWRRLYVLQLLKSWWCENQF
jgi:hypothetical protein